MQFRKWHSVILCLAIAHTATYAEEEIDIDKVSYFCGNRLGDMLSHFCNAFYSKRSKREVARTCCNGLGCSVRYAIVNYCREIKPEYTHLFNQTPSDILDFSAESKKILTDALTPSSIKVAQSPDHHHSKILSAIRKNIQEDTSTTAAKNMERDIRPIGKQVRTRYSSELNKHSPHPSSRSVLTTRNLTPRSFKRSFKLKNSTGTQCKCRCKRRKMKQMSDSKFPLSGSFIGTDPVPHGNPVHATTKYNFFF